MGVTHPLFNMADGGFMGQASIDAYDANAAGPRVQHHLDRFRSRHLGFLDDGVDLFSLVEHHTAPKLPRREGAESLTPPGGSWAT